MDLTAMEESIATQEEAIKNPPADAPAAEAPKEDETPAEEAPASEEAVSKESLPTEDKPAKEVKDEPKTDGEEPAAEPAAETPAEDDATEAVNPAHERIKDKKIAEAEARARNAELETARLRGAEEERVKNAAPQENLDPEPDPLEDPEGHTDWRFRQQDKKFDELTTQNQELQNQNRTTEAENLWMETDKRLAAGNETYKNAMEFVNKELPAKLKAEYPNASEADILKATDIVIKQKVGQYAASGLDESRIASNLILDAQDLGFNATAPAPVVDETKTPATDKREVSHHKDNAGGVANVSEGGGSGKLTSHDIAKMSTMEDLFTLGSMTDSEWKSLAKEAR